MAKVINSDTSVDSCSFGGTVFEADENGVFEVPAEAVAALAAHGFTPAPPTAPPKSEKKPKAKE